MMRTVFIAAALLFAVVPARADVTGTPRVIDGETLEVAGTRYRLQGIDAPDLAQKCEIRGRKYDCGNVARTALMDLVAGTEIRCVPRGGMKDGVRLARCLAGGYDLSEGMVYTGWALAMPRSGSRFAPIERAAAKARRGLWQGKFVLPWDWRPR